MQIRVTFASQSLDFHMRVVRDNVHELSIATATNGKADASTCDCNRVAVSVQIEGSQQTTRTQQHASITNLNTQTLTSSQLWTANCHSEVCTQIQSQLPIL